MTDANAALIMSFDIATLRLLASLHERGLLADFRTAATLGVPDWEAPGKGVPSDLPAPVAEFPADASTPPYFAQFLARLGFSRFFAIDGIADAPASTGGIETRLIRHDLNEPFEPGEVEDTLDLVFDLGVSQRIFHVAGAYQAMHRLCRKGGMIFVRQPMFGGTGYFNFIPEYFEDMAALNRYEVLHSSYVANGHHIPLSSRLPDNINAVSRIDLCFVFRRTNSEPFRIPYQSLAIRDAFGIAGYVHDFTPAGARIYRPLMINQMGREFSAREAGAALWRIAIRKIRRFLPGLRP